ncbi:MAG TPA: carboxypeptidase-like regulatory domain-containing protein [Chthoniobacterales bacterium]|jgi:hypothetical protein
MNYCAAIALFGMLGVICAGEASSESGIEGVIKIGPTQPGPIKADTPPFMPLPATAFVAQSEDGVITSFQTDSEGRFRVALAPGHYKISIKGPRPAIGHFGPFSVDVTAGKLTHVEWECDSGIR